MQVGCRKESGRGNVQVTKRRRNGPVVPRPRGWDSSSSDDAEVTGEHSKGSFRISVGAEGCKVGAIKWKL